MISTITLDTYKQQIGSGDAFNLSDSFNGRVGDEQVPLVVQFKERGLAQQFQDGLVPFMSGFVGSLDENNQVTAATGEAVSYVGTSNDIVGLGRVKMNLPGTMFPQEGYFYGFLGLQNADGKRVTTFNVWFHVYNGNPDMFVNKEPFRTELQKLLDAVQSLIDDADGDLNKWKQKLTDLFSTLSAQGTDTTTLLTTLQAQIKQSNLFTQGQMDELMGSLTDFKPVGSNLINKLNNEFSDRGINVKWFGAKGDGVNDDTSAIESAISTAEKGAVKRVYFPAGKYLTTTTNRHIGDISLVGENRMTSTIVSNTKDPVFLLETNVTIDNLGFHANSGDDNTMLGISKNGDNDVAHWNIVLTNLRFDSIEYPDPAKAKVGNWGLKAIYFNLDNLGLWDLTIKNVSMQYVYAGITFDIKNKGWLTGSVVDDVVVKGFTHHAMGIISSNNTSAQITQCTFAHITAQVLYETTGDDAAGFIISGVGNTFDNLMLFNDGTYNGHAIALRYFGNGGASAPNFAAGATANNQFIGGTIEGDIFDPDNLRQYQIFDGIKMQVMGKSGYVQEVMAATEEIPNLLSPQGFHHNIVGDILTNIPKDAKATTGADSHGTYIDIQMGATGGEYTYMITESQATVNAIKDGPFTIGLKYIDMSADNSANMVGYLRFNGKNGPMNCAYIYTNPGRYKEVKEIVWVYPAEKDYFASITDFTGLNQVCFYLNPGNHVRIYGAMLAPGQTTDFSQLTDSNMNLNGPGANPQLAKGAEIGDIAGNLIKFSGTYFVDNTNRPTDTPAEFGQDNYLIIVTPANNSGYGMIQMIDPKINTIFICLVNGGVGGSFIKLRA